MAIHSAARTAGSPMITESEIVRPPPTTWIAAARSIGPSLNKMNQATTTICPTNIAAKMNRPHRAVPQNFQIRGGRWVRMTGMGAAELAESRESINGLSIGGKGFGPSRQRPFQQAPYIVVGEIDRAVHAGVIAGEPRRREQFRVMRRYLVKRSRGSEQRQLLDRQPRHALAIRPVECLADERYRVAGAGQAFSLLGEILQNRAGCIGLARQRPQHVQAHHIARTLPDRIDRRFPVMPRQNALLHIAVAAEALHRLVEKSRGALANPVFDGWSQQPHI